MTATVHILPVVRRVHFDDPAWREQQRREIWARTFDEMAPPQRTRPIVISGEISPLVGPRVDVPRARQLIVGQRPEHNKQGES